MSYPQNYPTSPSHIWSYFYKLSQIPRPSKKEEKVVQFLIELAKEKELKYKQDSVSNIVIYVPATKGYENKETVIIQNHIDMVCDKTPDKIIDFSKDPIDLIVEDGWLKADRTTLGADNGIGVAAALALLDSDEVEHPPLELLFTTDEETGLNGALGLDASMLSGKKLLNLDTEEWGSVYIGCAGGVDYEFTKSFKDDDCNNKAHLTSVKLRVEGLKGGHSGLDIHRGRLSAIKIMATTLKELTSLGISLNSFDGGRAHNIIPRYAYATIGLEEDKLEKLKSYLEKKKNEILKNSLEEDNGLILDFDILEKTNKSLRFFDKIHTDNFINLLNLFPHGAHDYYWESKDPLVKFSNNLARVILKEDKLYIQSSLRFFERSSLVPLENQLVCLAESFGLNHQKNTEYPSWTPQFNSKLLEQVKDVYKENFKEEAHVLAIHAGLECGILKEKLGDIEAISIGPTIFDAHSPSERLHIESTGYFWKFFKEILRSF